MYPIENKYVPQKRQGKGRKEGEEPAKGTNVKIIGKYKMSWNVIRFERVPLTKH